MVRCHIVICACCLGGNTIYVKILIGIRREFLSKYDTCLCCFKLPKNNKMADKKVKMTPVC